MRLSRAEEGARVHISFRRTRRGLVALVASIGLLATVASPAEAAPRYRPASFAEMLLGQTLRLLTFDPTSPPPGMNNWACQPSAAHPNPVVLVHGLFSNRYNGWAFVGPTLVNEGYCVFALNYGGFTPTFVIQGMKPITSSALEVDAFIQRVQSTTGAAKVDLVGHSEGGIMVEYVPKMVPGAAARVGRVVALAPPTHGTTVAGVTPIVDVLGLRALLNLVLPLIGCGACSDVLAGSEVVNALNDGPIAVEGITYTVIATAHDAVVTPVPDTSFINEPGVSNILVQDVCPNDPVGHAGLAYDSGVVTMIGNALDPSTPDPVVCVAGPAI